MKHLILFTLTLIIYSGLAQAKFPKKFYRLTESECNKIDLRNENLGTVRNQKDVSWCYAYAATDLISYKYNLPRYSAAHLATKYNENRFMFKLRRFLDLYMYFFKRELFYMEDQTGFVELALKKARTEGLCHEETLSSEYATKVIVGENGQLTKKQVRMKVAQLDMQKLRQKNY
jgi:C1A family cysteine protease